MNEPSILTQSGQYFLFNQPERYELNFEDIVHGLSNCCRFAGQCRPFYSVAQHSVYVSQLVPREHQLAALWHDCAEAFLGDVSSPLKRLLPDYRALEKRVEAALFEKLNIAYPLHKCVKKADLQMLRFEQHHLMPEHDDDWAILQGVEMPSAQMVLGADQFSRAFIAYSPPAAYKAFMDRLYYIVQRDWYPGFLSRG